MRKRARHSGYSVFDEKGRRIAGGLDRETAVRIKDRAVQSGLRDVSLIRQGQDKQPGPRVFE